MATDPTQAELKATPVPIDWTDKIAEKERVQRVLASSVDGDPNSLNNMLVEKQFGDEYVFSYKGDFYFLNWASGETFLVLDYKEKDKDKLWAQMNSDIKKVKVKML